MLANRSRTCSGVEGYPNSPARLAKAVISRSSAGRTLIAGVLMGIVIREFPPKQNRKRCGKTRDALEPSNRFLGIEQNRDRAIVYQLDLHMRLKHPGFHSYAKRPHQPDKFLVKTIGFLRRSGLNERRSPPSSRVTIQSKLRHDQRSAPSVEDRQVHLARFIGKNSQ